MKRKAASAVFQSGGGFLPLGRRRDFSRAPGNPGLTLGPTMLPPKNQNLRSGVNKGATLPIIQQMKVA
jgi:hypothetical protein